jgi:hypothetical protein
LTECRKDYKPLEQKLRGCQLSPAEQRAWDRRIKREESIEAIWCEKCQAFQRWHHFEMNLACSVCGEGVGFFVGDKPTPCTYSDHYVGGDGPNDYIHGHLQMLVVPYKINDRIHRT